MHQLRLLTRGLPLGHLALPGRRLRRERCSRRVMKASALRRFYRPLASASVVSRRGPGQSRRASATLMSALNGSALLTPGDAACSTSGTALGVSPCPSEPAVMSEESAVWAGRPGQGETAHGPALESEESREFVGSESRLTHYRPERALGHFLVVGNRDTPVRRAPLSQNGVASSLMVEFVADFAQSLRQRAS